MLGPQGSPVIEACVVDISGSGLKVRAPVSVSCGAPVKIDGNNTLILGEVCRCVSEEGAYTVAIQVSHALSSLVELALLNAGWATDEPGELNLTPNHVVNS
jgi:hypothetical protein